PLLESTYTPGPQGGNGQLKPSSKPVTLIYNGVSPNYTLANRTGSMSVLREDALVGYAGDTAVTCSTCSAVVVHLRAVVTETDSDHGDLRNAAAAFINRTTGATIARVPVGADGVATFTWTVNLGTSTVQTTKIG